MPTWHIQASIAGLLRLSNKKLARLFDMDGQEARKELQQKLSLGEIYIPSESCTHFNPQTGCECGKYEQQSIT